MVGVVEALVNKLAAGIDYQDGRGGPLIAFVWRRFAGWQFELRIGSVRNFLADVPVLGLISGWEVYRDHWPACGEYESGEDGKSRVVVGVCTRCGLEMDDW